MLSNKKVLMVMAHPDDEIIFGWSIFQDKSIEKKLLICSSDFHNKEREWCKYRKDALFEICKELNKLEADSLKFGTISRQSKVWNNCRQRGASGKASDLQTRGLWFDT